jgi:uncharacterized repeat protein (TIGR02543 family)
MFTDLTIVTGNITLYAKWVGNPHTITFDTMGGSTIEPIVERFGNYMDLNAILPTKDNYKFVGWYSDENLTQEVKMDSYLVQGDITLYAKWVELPVLE